MGTTRREVLTKGFLAVGMAAARSRAAAIVSTSRDRHDDYLLSLTATEVLDLFASGELTSEYYARLLLAQCRRHRDLNSFIWLNEEHLLASARAADARRRRSPKPLLGVPLALKDNIDTAQAPTTAGTPALRGHVPRANAPVAAAIFSAGALLLGKTNMHELAFGFTSDNRAFGAVHNPYDRAMIPGGSSGGNGAAIAARLCPAGLGTDTGGSVRVPSALCGIMGLRTSIGRYSMNGVVPLSHTRDTVGPMARSIADLSLLDSVITGDWSSIGPTKPEKLRLGVPRRYFYDNLDHEIVPVVEKALAELRAAGCTLIEADIPNYEALSSFSARISYYECVADLAHYLAVERLSFSAGDVIRQIASPDVRELYETYGLGPQHPTREWYEHALAVHRPALKNAYNTYFRDQEVAAIVLPTTVLPARPIGQDTEVELNGQKVSTLAIYARNTRPATAAGLPGLSIPIGLTAAGLPVGIEFDGPEETDRNLLGIGLTAERVFGKIPAPPI